MGVFCDNDHEVTWSWLTSYYWWCGNIHLRFSNNSEAMASELLENPEYHNNWPSMKYGMTSTGQWHGLYTIR